MKCDSPLLHHAIKKKFDGKLFPAINPMVSPIIAHHPSGVILRPLDLALHDLLNNNILNLYDDTTYQLP